MKITAAVLYSQNAPFQIEEVELAPPGPGEVLVKLSATGICHTDLTVAKDYFIVPPPVVLGHEGAGIVMETGAGVSSVKTGDHVVLTGLAACGHCKYCAAERPFLCETHRPLRTSGYLPGNVKRLSKNGRAISHFFLQSSFATWAVVPDSAAIKIREDAPLDVVCYLGCGGMTGLGMVLNTARVPPGASVAVFGCGSVGLSAVMGAKMARAAQIIAVDVVDAKLKMAQEVGATHCINGSKEDAIKKVAEITGGGAEYNFMAVGSNQVASQVINTMPAGAMCVIAGSPKTPDQQMNIDMFSMIREKVVRGSTFGSSHPWHDIPLYVNQFMAGQLPLDKLITRRYSLSEINQAMHDLETGQIVKGIIVF